MNQNFAIIGDIHGDADRLAALTSEVEGRRLVFVGDYINRGKYPRETLEQLIAIRESNTDAVFLRGNHEDGLLRYLSGNFPFYKLAAMGGLGTLKSYLPRASNDVREEFLRVFPPHHREFLCACPDYFETPDFLVSHCGVNPNNPNSRTRIDMVTSSHEELFSWDLRLAKLVICGHYTQSSCRPYVNTNFICIDTGSGKVGGCLTALLLPERTFVQS